LKFLYFCSCVRGCELESSRLLQQHPHHLWMLRLACQFCKHQFFGLP
jgi:hypothetical protein